MESRSDKYRKCKAEDRRMMIKKHFTEKKKKSSSSKDDAKKDEKNKDGSESAEKSPGENPDSRPPSRNSSPDPNCPICLEPLTNKSFTDSCFHTFCFTCLVEWSKVKPECPLCKQTFKSIVHNVQSDFSYDEYHIHGRTSLWTICATEPRFRYPTTMTAARMRRDFDSYQNTYHNQMESHRMRYAPHAVRLYNSSQNLSRVPCSFRLRVYNRGLWVRPAVGNRVRTVSPDFFRRNPACTHRLLPWLNRELVALLQDNETQLTFVLELIMALIARYQITSQEFFIHIEPYLGDKTRHFIHELYNFAISPHDMELYDIQAVYSGPTDSQHLDGDNEVRIVEEDRARIPRVPSPTFRPKKKRRLNLIKSLQKIVIKKNAQNNWELGTNALNLSNPGPSTSTGAYSGSSTSGATGTFLGSSSSGAIGTYSGGSSNPIPALPSTSSTIPFEVGSESPIRVPESEEEECQVVEVLKPKSERTPEIVDLSSDEEVPPALISISSGSEYDPVSPPYRTYFPHSPSYIPVSPTYSPPSTPIYSSDSPAPSSSSRPVSPPDGFPMFRPFYHPRMQPFLWEPPPPANYGSGLPLFSANGPPSTTEVPCVGNSSDCEVVYEGQENNQPPQPRTPPGLSLPYNLPSFLFPENYSNGHSSTSTSENKDVAQDLSVPKKKLSSAIVRPWAMRESPKKEKSPSKKSHRRKRRASSLDSMRVNLDSPCNPEAVAPTFSGDATTSSPSVSSHSLKALRQCEDPGRVEIDGYSDSSSTDERNGNRKKLKLRSVVAHFSFDSSGKSKDSSHRPSHKKHKDKKKKKKAHKHKRKQRVLSDTDTS